MTVIHAWAIANLERNVADGKITTVHWTLSSTDGTYSAGAYGSIGLEGEVVTPYKDLTPDLVVGWVKAHFGDEKVKEIEDALAAQIEEQKAPKTASGCPWTAAPATAASAAA